MDQSRAIPARPRLLCGIEMVPVDREKVLLRSFSGTTMLSGEFVSSILPALLPRLDGTRTVDELREAIDEGFGPELEAFLRLLAEKKLLHPEDPEEVDSRPGPPSGLTGHERAYWSLHASSAAEAEGRLGSSTVVVAGLGGVGTTVARALANSGVGGLVLVDAHRVRPSDELFGYATGAVGRPRAEAIAAEVSGRKCREVSAVVSTVDGASDWDRIVARATVVVLCSDNHALAGYDRTNEACIRLGTRWSSARVDRARGLIGPFVVPGQTACFQCFELRNRANADHPSDHEAMYRHWKRAEDCPEDWPALAPFASIVGSHVALDLLRVLGGQQLSAFFGRVLHLDLQTLESRPHEILKLPRCPACSRARERPMTRIWDIRPGADARSPV